MNRSILTRAIFVPTWSNQVLVRDKKSDAVAYVGTNGNGKPCAAVFYGNQAKPVARYSYPHEAARAQAVASWFASRQAHVARKEAERAERSATGRGVEVGTVLVSSWGYEQTNVNFYVVTELVGKTQAIVRACASVSVAGPDGAAMTDKVVPNADAVHGEPLRVQIKAGRATIRGNHAHTWEGRPMYSSSYH